jgi:hypothetical protein
MVRATKIAQPRKTFPVLLGTATITIAALSIRLYSADVANPTPQPTTTAPRSASDDGMINAWEAGNAAITEYLADVAQQCLPRVVGP